jgi:hypothetical protein
MYDKVVHLYRLDHAYRDFETWNAAEASNDLNHSLGEYVNILLEIPVFPIEAMGSEGLRSGRL